jgi:hypothetical protein
LIVMRKVDRSKAAKKRAGHPAWGLGLNEREGDAFE